MMDERWEAATAIVVQLLSIAVLGIVLVSAVPSLRARLAVLGGRQAYAWRYGRWLSSQTPTPQWTKLLTREDLPQESA